MSGSLTTRLTLAAVTASFIAVPQAVAGHGVRVIFAEPWYQSASVEAYIPAYADYSYRMCLWIEPDAVSPVYGGGFQFLLGLEDSTFYVQRVEAGGDLNPNWEYFTYRLESAPGSCVNCPPRFLRLVGLANLANGITPSSESFLLSGCVAEIQVHTTGDARRSGQCSRLSFFSFDCQDNSILSVGGDTIFTGTSGVTLGDEFDPLSCGAASPTWDTSLSFSHGAVCIHDPFDGPGDPNIDGVFYSIGDAIFFVRYFVLGEAAFYSDPSLRAIQIYQSDINYDGVNLTVADYLALLNILVSGEQAYSKSWADASPLSGPDGNAILQDRAADGNYTLSVQSDLILGGLHLVFRVHDAVVGEPILVQPRDGITLRSNRVGNDLRVFIGPPPGGAPVPVASGGTEVLRIPSSDPGSITLAHADASDLSGKWIRTTLPAAAVPSSFALGQNIPNPFNAGTIIPFSLDQPGHARVDVFDLMGRLVSTLADSDFPAGHHEVAWDARDNSGNPVATGIYLYRLKTTGGRDTRKMILLK